MSGCRFHDTAAITRCTSWTCVDIKEKGKEVQQGLLESNSNFWQGIYALKKLQPLSVNYGPLDTRHYQVRNTTTKNLKDQASQPASPVPSWSLDQLVLRRTIDPPGYLWLYSRSVEHHLLSTLPPSLFPSYLKHPHNANFDLLPPSVTNIIQPSQCSRSFCRQSLRCWVINGHGVAVCIPIRWGGNTASPTEAVCFAVDK